LADPIHTTFDDLIRPGDPEILRRLVTYWRHLRGDRAMPSFKEIDPVEIPWALSRIYVLDVLPDGDMVYRLAGDDVARRYGGTLKGRRIFDLFPKRNAEMILSRWRLVADQGMGVYTDSIHPTALGNLISARRVTLPLGDGTLPASQILGIVSFQRVEFEDDRLSEPTRVSEVRIAPTAPRSA